MKQIVRYERAYLPLCEVADKPFHIQGNMECGSQRSGEKTRQFVTYMYIMKYELDFPALNERTICNINRAPFQVYNKTHRNCKVYP